MQVPMPQLQRDRVCAPSGSGPFWVGRSPGCSSGRCRFRTLYPSTAQLPPEGPERDAKIKAALDFIVKTLEEGKKYAEQSALKNALSKGAGFSKFTSGAKTNFQNNRPFSGPPIHLEK